MKRKEKEVRDFNEIFDILNRCDTIRLGLADGNSSYVVPVSFGTDIQNGKAVIFFHGAACGLKHDFLARCSSICMEADIFYGVETTEIGITTHYESVIGFGKAEPADEAEKKYGLRKLLEHYGYSEYPVDRCRGLIHTTVYKIVLDSITAKTNLKGHVSVRI